MSGNSKSIYRIVILSEDNVLLEITWDHKSENPVYVPHRSV